VQRLGKQHADELEKAVKRQLGAQQKQLDDKATTERKAELKQLREVMGCWFVFLPQICHTLWGFNHWSTQTLEAQHREEVEKLTLNMAQRAERDQAAAAKKALEEERKRLQRDFGHTKAFDREKVREYSHN
jgi:hypothetical protein